MQLYEQNQERWKQQGIQQGIQQGREEGREEGIEEGLERAAKNMLNRGVPKSRVKEFTDLPDAVLDTLLD